MEQLKLQVDHLVGLDKERKFHNIEVTHYSKKVEKMEKKKPQAPAQSEVHNDITQQIADQLQAQKMQMPMKSLKQMTPFDRN